MKSERVCGVCGVKNDTKRVRFFSKFNMYLCDKHSYQMNKYGMVTDSIARTIHDKNEIVKHEDYAEIILRNKMQDIIAKAIIDLDDVERVRLRKWSAVKMGHSANLYVRSARPNITLLHRFILGYMGPLEIDHINRNPLDNRRQNLRIVTRSENASNREAKHVYKQGDKWVYEITRYGCRFKKAGFETQEDAEKAFNACLKDISQRVNELIDQFNRQNEINPYKGVYLSRGKYEGIYYHKGKKYRSAKFETPEEACDARAEMIKKVNDE